mgnify:CR=1 FL=1
MPIVDKVAAIAIIVADMPPKLPTRRGLRPSLSTTLAASIVPMMFVTITRALAATALESPASAKTFVLKKTTALMPANCWKKKSRTPVTVPRQ